MAVSPTKAPAIPPRRFMADPVYPPVPTRWDMCPVHTGNKYTSVCLTCVKFLCQKCLLSEIYYHQGCSMCYLNDDVHKACDKLKDVVIAKMETAGKVMSNFHTSLKKKRERMLKKRNETVNEIKRYYNRLRDKMLAKLKQDEKGLLDIMAEKVGEQDSVISEKIEECVATVNMMEEKRAMLLNLERLCGSRSGGSSVSYLKNLVKTSDEINKCAKIQKDVADARDAFLVIRFFINSGTEEAILNCKVACVEVLNSRTELQNGESLESEIINEVFENANSYSDTVQADSAVESSEDFVDADHEKRALDSNVDELRVTLPPLSDTGAENNERQSPMENMCSVQDIARLSVHPDIQVTDNESISSRTASRNISPNVTDTVQRDNSEMTETAVKGTANQEAGVNLNGTHVTSQQQPLHNVNRSRQPGLGEHRTEQGQIVDTRDGPDRPDHDQNQSRNDQHQPHRDQCESNEISGMGQSQNVSRQEQSDTDHRSCHLRQSSIQGQRGSDQGQHQSQGQNQPNENQHQSDQTPRQTNESPTPLNIGEPQSDVTQNQSNQPNDQARQDQRQPSPAFQEIMETLPEVPSLNARGSPRRRSTPLPQNTRNNSLQPSQPSGFPRDDDPPPPYPGLPSSPLPPGPDELPPPYAAGPPPPYSQAPESPHPAHLRIRGRSNAASGPPRAMRRPASDTELQSRDIQIAAPTQTSTPRLSRPKVSKAFSVNEANDRRVSGIFAMLSIRGDSFLIVDRWNKKLKYFSSQGTSFGGLIFREEPWDITEITNDLVAVTVPKLYTLYKIRVTGNSVITTSTVSTQKAYACVAYNSASEMFVCGQVPQFGEPVIDLIGINGGDVIQSFRTGTNNSILRFSYPRYVKVNGEGTAIVCDWNLKCLTVFKLDGTVVGTYRGTVEFPLNEPTGIAYNPETKDIYVIDAKHNSTLGAIHIVNMECRCKEIIRWDNEFRIARAITPHGTGYALGNKSGVLSIFTPRQRRQ